MSSTIGSSSGTPPTNLRGQYLRQTWWRQLPVYTGPVTARACARTGATGVHFLQGYEVWMADREYVDMADREYVDSVWRLPLTKVAIAEWLVEKAQDLGVSAILVPNGIDSEQFPSGGPIAIRHCDVVGLASDIPGNLTDLLIEVLKEVERQRPTVSCAAFGTCPRPSGLPAYVDYFRSPAHGLLSALYRSSKVYLRTSDGEGWYLPPAEAKSSGTAVVSTDIQGVTTYGHPGCDDLRRWRMPHGTQGRRHAALCTHRPPPRRFGALSNACRPRTGTNSNI